MSVGRIGGMPSLPFQGAISVSRHCSWAGAKAAEPRAGSQAWRLLLLYKEHGPQTDHQAAAALDLPLATICARRGWLVNKNLVRAQGTTPGPFHTANTLWGIV